MLRAGITGGLGSGKTIVCKVLHYLGVPVFDADREAKKLLDNADVQREIHRLFSDQVFTGTIIDKKKLAQVIFNDDQALSEMNALIHPLVAHEFNLWAENFTDKHYVIIEAALLLESKQFSHLDAVITVFSPLELRLQRAMVRDRVSKQEILSRINKQMPDEEKCKLAQYILYNDDEHMLLPQILEMDKRLRKE